MNINDYVVSTIYGVKIPLKKFEGKKLMIVNTASHCGFTNQYESLQKLHDSNNNIVVIGFPCNQFGNQEPGSDSEIKDFCESQYSVKFLMSSKVEVNGENSDPLYVLLKSISGVENIPWNFTKFVVSEDRKSVVMYGPDIKPEDINI